MAERVSRKAVKAKKVRGHKLKGEVVTFPGGGQKPRRGKGKRSGPPPVGDNSDKYQGVPRTVWLKHLPLIAKAEIAKDKAKDAARTAASYYRDALRAAKDDGLPTAAIIEARKLDKKDHGEMVQHFADVGRALDLLGSNLGEKQLDLFGSIQGKRTDEIPSDPAKEGFAAGKRGDAPDTNPFIPGTPEHVSWDEQWRAGQKDLGAGIAKSEPLH